VRVLPEEYIDDFFSTNPQAELMDIVDPTLSDAVELRT